jgi:hypothetical protein
MSNESITNQPPLDAPEFPPLRRVVPMLVSQVLVGMLIAGAFVGMYIGLQRAPAPTRLPLAVADAQLARVAADRLGDAVEIHAVGSDHEARRLVRDRDVVAALVPGAAGFTLYTAGADGLSATGAATAVGTGLAEAAGGRIVEVRDLVPLVAKDPQGLAGFYLVFGTTLAAFVLAQIMYAVAGFARLRVRVVTAVIGSVAAAAVAAVIAGPVFGAVPASLGAAMAALSLLAVAVSLSTLAISSLIGPMGSVLSTLLFTTLGNSTSGATVSAFLLPPVLADVGAALPPGAAFRAVTELGYFSGGGVAAPLVVLAGWIAGAGLVLAVRHRPGRSTESA